MDEIQVGSFKLSWADLLASSATKIAIISEVINWLVFSSNNIVYSKLIYSKRLVEVKKKQTFLSVNSSCKMLFLIPEIP